MHPPNAGMFDAQIQIDSMVEAYADIAERAFARFLDQSLNPAAIDRSNLCDDHGEFIVQYESRQANGIKTIVFAAMAIEAAASQYVSMTLGDRIAENLNKMSLEKTWMIASRLICGQSLNAEGPAMHGLKRLNETRKALVNYTSTPLETAEQVLRKRWDDFNTDQVPNAFETLVLLSLELEALQGNLPGVLPYRRMTPPEGYPRHPGVQAVIDYCRMIHQDSQGGA